MLFLRTLVLILGTAAAYALLRGWPGELPPIVRACAAVLVLVAALGLWARRGRGAGPAAGPRRPPGAMDYLAIVAVVLAVECGFLWILSALPAPLETAALAVEERMRPQAAAARAPAAEKDRSGPLAGNWLWDDQTRRPLPRRTNFRPGNRPEVFIRLRDRGDAAELLRGQVYVRAFALGRYERAAWSAYPPQTLVLEADAAGFVNLPERTGRTIVHEVFHSADPGGQNSLTAIHGVVAARVPRLTQLGDGLQLLPPPASAGGYDYVAASSPLRLEDILGRDDVKVPAVVPPELLALPELGILGPRLRELAAVAAGGGELPRRLLNLQNHLRTTLAYSLETTNARDLDPLENFLFHEQRGHCEFFATAGALLARAIGVPSRTAYGWAGGTYYESGNMFVFRALEAHAWTEVWLEGLGWVAMDPTPPSAIGGELARVARPGELPPTGDDGFSEDDMLAAGGLGGAPERAALWLMACFGLPAMVVLAGRRLFTRRRQIGGVAGGGESLPTPDYLRAWRRASARRGFAMKPGTTLRRHLARIPGGVPFAAELLDYHYGTRYEGSPPDPKLERRLIAAIRTWENGPTAAEPDAQTSILNSSR